MRSAMLVGATTILFCIVAASCGPNKPRYQPEPQSVSGNKPTQHWIYEEDLRAVMREIERSSRDVSGASDRELTASRPVRDVQYDFAAAAKIAGRLAASADALPQTVEGINLGPGDRAAFLEQAAALRDQAMNLGNAARGRRLSEMWKHLDAVTATCVSCHTRFRDFTGELAPPRV